MEMINVEDIVRCIDDIGIEKPQQKLEKGKYYQVQTISDNYVELVSSSHKLNLYKRERFELVGKLLKESDIYSGLKVLCVFNKGTELEEGKLYTVINCNNVGILRVAYGDRIFNGTISRFCLPKQIIKKENEKMCEDINHTKKRTNDHYSFKTSSPDALKLSEVTQNLTKENPLAIIHRSDGTHTFILHEDIYHKAEFVTDELTTEFYELLNVYDHGYGFIKTEKGNVSKITDIVRRIIEAPYTNKKETVFKVDLVSF